MFSNQSLLNVIIFGLESSNSVSKPFKFADTSGGLLNRLLDKSSLINFGCSPSAEKTLPKDVKRLFDKSISSNLFSKVASRKPGSMVAIKLLPRFNCLPHGSMLHVNVATSL